MPRTASSRALVVLFFALTLLQVGCPGTPSVDDAGVGDGDGDGDGDAGVVGDAGDGDGDGDGDGEGDGDAGVVDRGDGDGDAGVVDAGDGDGDGEGDAGIDDAGAGCDEAALAAIEDQIVLSLSAIDSDADFSLHVENAAGRAIVYERGASTMETVIDSASTAKWISASVILAFMQSAENLASPTPLTLDSHPQDFLTEDEWPIPAGDSLEHIELRHLLSFTSGLDDEPNCIKLGTPIGSTLSSCVTLVGEANFGTGRVPGAGFYYAGTHLHVAALMAVRARNIALGIATSTWHAVFDDFKADTGVLTEAVYSLPTLANPRIAGGIRLNGNEYVDFLRKFFERTLLVDDDPAEPLGDLHDLQIMDHRMSATTEYSPALAGPLALDWHYGFGLWLECVPDAIPFDCTGTDVVSSAGAYGAYPFMSRNDGYFGFLSMEGGLGTGFIGYEHFASVRDDVIAWAAMQCPPAP